MNPGIPVPPQLYGGIERIVYLLAEEYHRLGHDVTLLAGYGSTCSGTTIIIDRKPKKPSRLKTYKDTLFVWRYLKDNYHRFDVIHNFGRLIYFLPVIKKPVYKMMSYQRAVAIAGIKKITSLQPANLLFTGCSNYCVSTGNVAGNWHTVYNAINFSDCEINEHVEKNAPLMFLGRLDKVKGVHNAIKVAQLTGNQLLIAGNIPHTADNYQYYKAEIEPLIDGEQIKYVGELDDAGKNLHLRQVKALLFPIEWEEPFGIVMIEAMACGTPVIAFNRGAVPEVIDESTGIIVNTIEQMCSAVAQVHRINRRNCRKSAEERFDIRMIAQQYLQLILK
jgi:glycosyltransferase involved in cell wall biosynthesis